mmetsp:Transcript_17378/g.31544  ORF Transcript_17378/g.31544 Transcript_17378/m.31544 type:complete len:174 (+) Transcript_17378:102-623(+)|eukprot:CAMPEP_0202002164 /NCGR_PEP_ID=MMETSP0905-20130828/8073_1 /ASSEMBLY_ACC=CAM_ASM_000554 /TAXON_ID=420261 /ORGANISM="Thalassiosira antarctica, Strain CCMP982" /LENGTH=173 /DNA_ID=CAMNT_0048558993 /DNA_START=83 /DNA_END=604 /DNA_ORIENTATION=+
MSLQSFQSTSRRYRHGVILAYLSLFQLLCVIHPASAIGGWETIHIMFSRLNGERSGQNDLQKSPRGSKSIEERIAPVPDGDESSSSSSGKKEEGGGGGASNKKRHVGEVTMTSTPKRTSSLSSISSPVASSSSEEEESVPAAFVPRGRRGGMLTLDENDLRTITFVSRSNPFM